MHWQTAVSLTLAGASVAACGGTQGTRPEDMSAAAHRQEAAAHQQESDEHRGQYDPSATRTRTCPGSIGIRSGSIDGVDYADDVCFDDVYNPTDVHRSAAERHQEHARDHAAAAEALEQFEEAECGAFVAETRRLCPLLGQLSTSEDIPNGVRLRFHDSTNLDAVAAHMQCHRAFAQTQGREGMPHCPLYLLGVQVQKIEGAVELTVSDEDHVATLRERVRRHIEP